MDSTNPNQPMVAIILVNFHSWRDTIECLESVFRLSYPNFRVLVVDNGSQDASLDKIAKWARGNLDLVTPENNSLSALTTPPVPKPIHFALHTSTGTTKPYLSDETKPPLLHLIQAIENRGYAAGNNIGLHAVNDYPVFEYIWLLNNDTVVHPDALSELVNRTQVIPEVALCGSTLCYYDHPDLIQARAGATYNRWFAIARHIDMFANRSAHSDVQAVERKLLYISGASMFFTRKYFEAVGCMNEDYFLYSEEIDWATRGVRLGFRLGYAPGSIVYHKEGITTGANNLNRTKTPETDFYGNRNRLVFTRKYFPYCLPTVWLALVGSLFVRLLRRRWRLAWQVLTILFGRRSFHR